MPAHKANVADFVALGKTCMSAKSVPYRLGVDLTTTPAGEAECRRGS